MAGQIVVPDCGPAVIFVGHKTYLMSVMKFCRESGHFFDVTILCQDGQLSAHKLVLASASKFLGQVLLDHSAEDEPPVITIPDVKKSSLEKILDFIYTGKMLLSAESACELQSLVQALGIDPDNVRLDNFVKTTTTVTQIKLNEMALKTHFEVGPGFTEIVQPRIDDEIPVEFRHKPVATAPMKRRTSTESQKLGGSPVATAPMKRRTSTDSQKLGKRAKMSVNSGATPTLNCVRGRGRPAKSHLSSETFLPSGFHDISRKDTWVCAICECYDPPEEGSLILQTTEWIGCDCNRWYHKHCIKLKKIDDSFCCKNVNLACLPTA